MTVVLDANVLLRLADPTCAAHGVAVSAVRSLLARGDALRIVPQSVYEYWVVATRPIAVNGLGLSATECSRDVARIKAMFPLLNDLPALFAEWESIVAAFACHGKTAHDARYIAAIRLLGVKRFLTFNVGDFTRYPDIEILDPMIVAENPQPQTL